MEPNELRLWLADMAERTSQANQLHARRALRCFYKFATAERLIRENPMANIKGPRKVKEPVVNSANAADVRPLVQACREQRLLYTSHRDDYEPVSGEGGEQVSLEGWP